MPFSTVSFCVFGSSDGAQVLHFSRHDGEGNSRSVAPRCMGSTISNSGPRCQRCDRRGRRNRIHSQQVRTSLPPDIRFVGGTVRLPVTVLVCTCLRIYVFTGALAQAKPELNRLDKSGWNGVTVVREYFLAADNPTRTTTLFARSCVYYAVDQATAQPSAAEQAESTGGEVDD